MSDDLFRRYWALFGAVILVALVGCAGDEKSWPQFHGEAPSQGSLLEVTDPAFRPIWEFDVGPFDAGKPQGSPVVGPDGTIYIGNLDGDIIAVNPDGTEAWRATTPFLIFSAPAVADDGTIYAIGTSFIPDVEPGDNKFRATLITLAPDGTVLDLSIVPDQGFTAGSPKVWSSGDENYVFLHANTRLQTLPSHANALFVFDRDGDLLAQEDLGCTLPVTGSGPSILDLLEDLWDLISIEFDAGGTVPPPDPDDYGWIDPTLAVAVRDDVVGPGNAFVVVADQACSNLWAFRWDPPELERLWFVDEADKFIASSSPAVLNDAALIVIGRADGKVIAYEPVSGDKLWTFDAEEKVLGTPASLARQVYVARPDRVYALEPSDGEIFRTSALVGRTIASPILSAKHVYLSQAQGFQTFDLTLNPITHDFQGGIVAFAGSPAIDRDGVVYTLVLRDGRVFLRAYPAS